MPRLRLHPLPARPLAERSPVSLRIIEARHSAGLTQAQVAAKLGTSREYVVRVETSAKRPPRAHLAAWADVLGLDMAELEALR